MARQPTGAAPARTGAAPARTGEAALAARATLLEAFAELDGRLATRRYLLGDRLTEADVRLWVTLVRYDARTNHDRAVNPGLAVYPHLWAYARDLYRQKAFKSTMDFSTCTVPGASNAHDLWIGLGLDARAHRPA
ncbi:glutathione S-transferase C-terminal domain-containing protein [Streptomyces sp. CB01881]|uniref:glutathione S-transferase C-terminal domain-containing protein n=1 Tax=Streptomyces sp. CB01881 TaxID=2078691 RepID=UPI000CDC80A7|nr:glutathione S-transferase C-terminal domain-containing protein [Streptomyces sp. CB01881]AUY54681.1 hypothetical protein C2142_34195 [Streptomyces sp. CB01881]TYC69743.1 hypothetical protein EH183_34265 [Streptomyces sp. CB01881]